MESLQRNIESILDLFKSKNFKKAEILGKELSLKYPEVAYLYNIVGLTLNAQKKTDEAIKNYLKGIDLEPNSAILYDNLGTAYKSKGLYDKAFNSYEKSIKLDSTKPEPYNNLGSLLLNRGDFKNAVENFKKALKINNNFFPSHYNLGITFTNIGKFDEAKKHLKKTIEINPHFFSAHRNLSKLIKYKLNDDHFISLKKIYNDTIYKNLDKTEIAFALGKAYEDVNDYKKSFKFYKSGNDLRKEKSNFVINDEKKDFNNIKNFFNIKIFKNNINKLKSESKFIFILGMPRSGTTLVEQILSSHKKVFGGDEINLFPKLVKKNFIINNKYTLGNKSINLTFDEYCNYLKVLSNNSPVITDKLPINFKWIGFIKLVFPNAKIIHCNRNPKDICLSIFKNYFVSKNLNFAYSLDDIVQFYNLYSDLMKFWKELLKDEIIDINYENLVNNTNHEIKKLIKKCDLPWDDNCLQFYKNQRPIKTASDTQARKKIYKFSINSWEFYKHNLEIYFNKLV